MSQMSNERLATLDQIAIGEELNMRVTINER